MMILAKIVSFSTQRILYYAVLLFKKIFLNLVYFNFYKINVSSSIKKVLKKFEYIYLNPDSRIPKYKQVMDSILSNINKANIEMGEKLPSINEVSEAYLLSRDTVEKAYRLLKDQNIIISVKGKGFYIAKTNLSIKVNILFLINKLSTYKLNIFNSFVNTIGANANVDLDIYHCEPSVFKSILNKKKQQYDYYAIMPHFKDENLQHMVCTEDILKSIREIPDEKLIIVDRNVKSLSKKSGRVYQNFTEDIYNALSSGFNKLKKYKKIILVYPNKAVYPYPIGILIGFKKYCIQHSFDYEILDKIYEGMELQQKDLFVIIEENDLVNLVKQSRDYNYKLGEDIGIISYNDTPLKELLGITVISTDFKKMGEEAARMILENKKINIKNDFNFIDRFSV